MIHSEHLEQFSEKLSRIVQEEIKRGNRVVETAKGWPETRTVMVFLEKPFSGDYSHLKLTFRDVDDPHYWKSEYFDEQTGHVLACKFGDSI